jgi:hypothetical protein
MRQPGSSPFDRSPEGSHEPCNYRFAVHKRELLTQHCADRKFKSIPHAWHAQTGSRLEHYAEPRILSKVICDLQRVGAEIKDASHPFNDQHELFLVRHRRQAATGQGVLKLRLRAPTVLVGHRNQISRTVASGEGGCEKMTPEELLIQR